MLRALLTAAALSFILIGCASRPAPRETFSALPPLEQGWARLYVSAGLQNGVRLWSVHQVGPVYINNQRVGSTAKDEHFVLDLSPGSYEAYCTPQDPVKNFAEKRQFTFKAGETRYLACDMEPGTGASFGLVGAIAADYLTTSHLVDRPLEATSKLVGYKKLR